MPSEFTRDEAYAPSDERVSTLPMKNAASIAAPAWDVAGKYLQQKKYDKKIKFASEPYDT